MKLAVIGAGSWGIALAHTLAESHDVRLWARHPDTAAQLERERQCLPYFTGTLNSRVRVTSSLQQAAQDATLVLIAVPTHGMREVATALAPHLASSVPVVSTAKGFELGSLMTMSEVVSEVMGRTRPVAALSGPNIALEIAQGRPAATVVAAVDVTTAAEVRDVCNSPRLRFYSTIDLRGVEYGGALKNVVAIAAGICDGLNLGDNGKAAVITRGIAEMARLGVQAGADPLTFAGLAGLGDCVVTCTSPHSRNRLLGQAIGRGSPVGDVVATSPMVAEGVNACRAAVELAQRYSVEMPITEAVHSVLFEGKEVAAAAVELMGRDPGDELRDLSGELRTQATP